MMQSGGNATSIGIYSLSKGPTPPLLQQETSAAAVVHRAVLAAEGSKRTCLWWTAAVSRMMPVADLLVNWVKRVTGGAEFKSVLVQME